MAEELHMEFVVPIKGVKLDRYLERGWYRMGAYIFTTHSLCPNGGEECYPVFWLRYDTHKVHTGSTAKKIVKGCKGMAVRFRRFFMTDELSDLYKRYHAALDFRASDSLESVLYDVNSVVYESWVVEVLDGNRLIAAGVFDRGQQTIAGIVNFYDPEYKRHSLGKLLVLLKLQFCRQQGIRWYYPGYYAIGYDKFDYKLFLDKNATEVYLPENDEWVAYTNFTPPTVVTRKTDIANG